MYAETLGVTRVDRHLAMSPRGTLIVVDDLASDEPRSWSWLLQSDHPWKRRADGVDVTEAGRAWLRVSALEEGERTISRRRTLVQANPTASTPSLAIEKTLHTLSRDTTPTTRTQFVTVLEPLHWTDHAPSQMSLHRTAAGLVVEVERAGSTERVAVSLDGTDPEAILGEPAHAAGGEIAVVGR